MSQPVTINLPEHLAMRAAAEAKRTSQPLETVLLEWLKRVGDDLDAFSDDEILALCESMMAPDLHEDLAELLAKNREGELNEAERQRLTELMTHYQQGLLRKAKASQIAVARGLKAGLN